MIRGLAAGRGGGAARHQPAASGHLPLPAAPPEGDRCSRATTQGLCRSWLTQSRILHRHMKGVDSFDSSVHCPTCLNVGRMSGSILVTQFQVERLVCIPPAPYQAALTRLLQEQVATQGVQGLKGISNTIMELRNICNHPLISRLHPQVPFLPEGPDMPPQHSMIFQTQVLNTNLVRPGG